jgi:hypothetical protein
MSRLRSLAERLLGQVKDVLSYLARYPVVQNLPVDEKTKAQWEKFLANYDWKEEVLKYMLWRLEQERKHERDGV